LTTRPVDEIPRFDELRSILVETCDE